jgi:hypothetical protein
MTDDGDQARLKRLRPWFDKRGLDHSDWDERDFLYGYGNLGAALLLAELFVPQFIELEGSVFLARFGVQPPGGLAEVREALARARSRSPEGFKEYVDSHNWIEVPYLFSDLSHHDGDYEALAALIVEAWRGRLLDLFPSRRFSVRVIDPDETGSVVGVGFEEISMH